MKELRDAADELGFALNAVQLVSFERYFHILVEWNERVNLTRIVGRDEVAIRHFLDSLTCLLAMDRSFRGDIRLIDVGAGAGFPGIPLKVAMPDLRLTLLESVGKKTAFLAHLVDALALPDVQIITDRAEHLAHQLSHRESYDYAVARAVSSLNTLAEYCLPFVRVGGRMIAQKTAAIEVELAEAQQAIATLGGSAPQTREIILPGLDQPRVLVIIDKARPTPAKYPRSAGLPAKCPL